MGLGDLADVRRYDGAQGARAHALQHSAQRQHPRGRGENEHGPTGEQESLAQHHAGPTAEQSGHVAGWDRAQSRADPEHRAERLRVLASDRERQLVVCLHHVLSRRRPSEYRAGGQRSQRRCNKRVSSARLGGQRCTVFGTNSI